MLFRQFVAHLHCILPLFSCIDASALTVETFALSKRQAPGASNGVEFLSFRLPVLNNAGEVAFVGRLSGTAIDETNDRGIWTGAMNNLRLVAREGSAAPDTPIGAIFTEFSTRPQLNDVGQVLLEGTITGPSVTEANDHGLWVDKRDGLALVVREGDVAPISPSGSTYGEFGQHSLNSSGVVAFSTGLRPDTPGNDLSLWVATADEQLLIAKTGDTPFGAPEGAPFEFVRFGSPGINDNGDSIFQAQTSSNGDLGPSISSIWSGSPGNIRLVLKEGDPAPGTGRTVTSISFPVMNNSGTIAFGATLDAVTRGSIWKVGANGISILAKQNDVAPGLAFGTRFDNFGHPKLNENGDIVFKARLYGGGVTNANDSSIWTHAGGELAILAREGDQAPGAATGKLFPQFLFQPHVLNNAGQVAFFSTLTNNGVPSSNDSGIWMTAGDGALRLVVRTGTVLELGPGDLRTVVSLAFLGADETSLPVRYDGFNDRGQLAFLAGLSDGTVGVFVAQIPEPSSMSLFVIALVLQLFRFHRTRTCPTTALSRFP